MTLIRPILISALHIALLFLIACSAPQATPAEEVSPVVSPSTPAIPTASPTSTPVQGVAATPSPASTRTPTYTPANPTASPTSTPVQGVTTTPSPSSTPTPTSTAAIPTNSPTSTPVQGVTTTPSPASTRTPTSSAAPTSTPVPTPESTPTHIPSPPNPTQEIPPCIPLEGISVDPCRRDAEPFELGTGGGGGKPNLGDEPRSLRGLLSYARTFITHIVVRGTYLPDTERCITGNPYRPPSFLRLEQYSGLVNALSIDCYVDLRVSDYILGSGPSTLTVLRHFFSYRVGAAQAVYIKQETGMSERAWFEDYSQRLEGDEYMGEIAGREEVLFIGPASSLSVEVWQSLRNLGRAAEGGRHGHSRPSRQGCVEAPQAR